jgi:predicted O-methyltransferase YrrM
MTLWAQYQARAQGRYSDIRGHLDYICERARGCEFLCELGVREGNSTIALLAAIEVTPVADAGGLWSVDIMPPQVPFNWRKLPFWRFLQADDLSEQARAFVPPKLDLLFIDTSHDQDHTLAELAAYGPRVRPGGVILCHDTCWLPGDIELREPKGPVARALDVWCQAQPYEVSWTNRAGSFGLGVIEVPS